MSQGMFGLVDFKHRIDRREDIAAKAGAFLRMDNDGKAEYSCVDNDHYILAMKRTSLAGSQQPRIAHNKDLGAACLIHGEIHNFQELRQEYLPAETSCAGELELILHLYRKEGPQFARKLNGLFSLAILDQRDSSLLILNDRFGLARQVFWTTVGNRLFFATHLKTILAFPGIRREVDPEGLNLFLKYSYITSPWSICKGIKKLPPGHLLVFRGGNVEVTPYWEFTPSAGSGADLHEAVAVYRDLLGNSISRRLGSPGETGILLSGGLDSSANVALAAQCSDSQLKTFSIGFEDELFDERPYARIVAKHFNTQHFEYTITGREIEDLPKLIWNLEEPYFEFGLFLTYLGLASASKEVEAVIGGEGADQMFGTGGFAGGRPAAVHYLLQKYRLLQPARWAGRKFTGPYFYDRDNLAFKLRLFWNRATDLNDWYFYGYDEHELLQLHRNSASASVPRIFPEEPGAAHRSFPDLYLATQITQDIRHYVNENVMVKSGRMADMLDVTLRESFLDPEVADFLVSLDFRLKRSGDLLDHLKGKIKTKFLHRKAMEGLLPAEILHKPKQGGFVPVMLFLKDPETRKNIYRHLLQSKVIGEYFRTDYLRALFGEYEAMQGKEVYWPNFYNSKANRILFLLTFDIWHHAYIENDPLTVQPVPLSDYLGNSSYGTV